MIRRILAGLIIGFLLPLILAAMISSAGAETRWAFCKTFLNVRREPDKDSAVVGFLDAGDSFETDGVIRNGFLRVQGVGEDSEGWVFAGYTSDEEPQEADERYVCVAKRRAACRRWTNGPRIAGKTGWIYNGSTLKVYYITSEWAVTNRGYVAAEWLERDPE